MGRSRLNDGLQFKPRTAAAGVGKMLVFKPINIETANGLAWRRADPFDDLFNKGGELGAYLYGGLATEAHRRCVEEIARTGKGHLVEPAEAPVLMVLRDKWRVGADVRELRADFKSSLGSRDDNLCLR